MTSTIALIGKSGSGKTTLSKAFLKLIKKNFPESSILMVDNDLTLELSDSFGIKTRKHEQVGSFQHVIAVIILVIKRKSREFPCFSYKNCRI